MDYEKKYKEALKRAKNHYSTTDSSSDIKLIGLIFPELKESDSEKIRKGLLALIEWSKSYAASGITTDEAKDMIAWIEKQGKNNMGISEATKQKLEDNLNNALEKETPKSWNEFLKKQGEQKPNVEMKTPEESLGVDSETYSKIVDECIYGEQKPADNVERKFKVGDFIANDYCVGKVIELTDDAYLLDTGQGIPFSCEHNAHLWSIQDAKDGDVLVSESNCGLNTWYCIFKSLDGDESMTVYCYLARDGRFETKKELCFDKDPYNTKPATKEQRNTLLKAMSDAGYTFNFESKELKKIEWKPDWSEEDERIYKSIAYSFAHNYPLTVQQQEFVKSIKERYTWKPSDEHYELEEFAKIIRGNLTCISKAVQELFEAKYLQLTGNKMYGGFKD